MSNYISTTFLFQKKLATPCLSSFCISRSSTNCKLRRRSKYYCNNRIYWKTTIEVNYYNMIIKFRASAIQIFSFL